MKDLQCSSEIIKQQQFPSSSASAYSSACTNYTDDHVTKLWQDLVSISAPQSSCILGEEKQHLSLIWYSLACIAWCALHALRQNERDSSLKFDKKQQNNNYTYFYFLIPVFLFWDSQSGCTQAVTSQTLNWIAEAYIELYILALIWTTSQPGEAQLQCFHLEHGKVSNTNTTQIDYLLSPSVLQARQSSQLQQS